MTVIARNYCPIDGYPYVMEDPDDNQDRIWINTTGYISSTLTPLYDKPNSIFSRNYLRPMSTNSTTFYNNTTISVLRPLTTSRGTIINSYLSMANPLWSTYHWSLDFTYYPNKIIWKSQNNRFISTDVCASVPSTSGATGVNGTVAAYREYKIGDFTTPVASTDTYSASGSGFGTIINMSGIMFEDVPGAKLYGISGDWVLAPRIRYFSNSVSYSYDTVGATLNESYSGTINYGVFFVGADSSNNTYWALMNNSTTNETFAFLRYTGSTQTTVIGTTGAGATSNIAKITPSNVRRDSASRRVFYVPMFTATNELVPRRIVWDPTQANTATLTACTMTYASGTYFTYSKKVTQASVTAYASGNLNSWRLKGHQFKVGSNWYVTFIGSDAYYPNNGSARWPDSLTLTAVTYSIGSGTSDDQLTYHSAFAFTATTLPKDWIPVNPDGNRLAIIQQDDKVGFMTFSEIAGWSIPSVYDVSCGAIGIDKYWRVWVTSTDPSTNSRGLVHILTTELPITFSITVPNQTFSYQGTNIATTATVNAYNYAGSRVATSIDLVITGSGMIFTSNSGKTLTVTTSASADTTVNLTVNGTGVSNIVGTASI